MSIISTKYLLQDAQAKAYAVSGVQHPQTCGDDPGDPRSVQRNAIAGNLAGARAPSKHIALEGSAPCAAPVLPNEACRWRSTSITTSRWMTSPPCRGAKRDD